jgi:hypothetical protein
MIGKVLRGTDARRLLYYLYGPGKANEHTDPHLVAGFGDAAELEPGRRPDESRDFRRLTGLLAQPLAALNGSNYRPLTLGTSGGTGPSAFPVAEYGRRDVAPPGRSSSRCSGRLTWTCDVAPAAVGSYRRTPRMRWRTYRATRSVPSGLRRFAPDMGATYGGRALSKSTSEWQRCTLGVAMMITSGLDDVGVVEFGAESADGDLDGLGERVGGFVPYLGWQVLGAEGGWGGSWPPIYLALSCARLLTGVKCCPSGPWSSTEAGCRDC